MADEIDALVETVQPAGPEAVLDCARPKAGGEKLRSRYDTVPLGRQRGDCAFAVIVGFPLYMEGNPTIVWTAP